MTEPRRAQPGARCAGPHVERACRRQLPAWNAPLTAAQEFRQGRRPRTCVAQPRQNRMNIAKAVAAPEARRSHALEAQAVGLCTQGFHCQRNASAGKGAKPHFHRLVKSIFSISALMVARTWAKGSCWVRLSAAALSSLVT